MCTEQKKIEELKYLQLALEKGKSLLSEEDTAFLRECPHPGQKVMGGWLCCTQQHRRGRVPRSFQLGKAVEKHPLPAHR
jgi:hypothetical protein